jgi:tetratricopeptide (TPR) repeat protein
MIAQGLSALANALRQAGDLEGALSSITEALALSEKAEFSNEMLRASALYAILWRQGVILGDDESVSLNRPTDAVKPLEEAFNLVEIQASKDPNDFSFRDRVGKAGEQLGDVLRRGDPVRALAIYDRTLVRLREIKDSSRTRRQEARILAHSSYPLRSLHRPSEARQRIDASFALLREMGEDATVVGIIGGEWDDALRASADLEAETGHPEKALAILLDLQAKLMALGPTPESDLQHANDMSRLYESIAQLNARLGRDSEAKRYRILRMDLWRLWNQKLPDNSFIKRQLEK